MRASPERVGNHSIGEESLRIWVGNMLKFSWYYIAVNYFQTLMGVFYYIRALALLEDLPLSEEHKTIGDFVAEVEAGYDQVSQVVYATRGHRHCWVT